ncbi:MAG TPA: hypothetical protein VNZ49_17660, partial [Bacteroidia bacterium]|nr:hypothetical protein [Bacteroidia bacterium]
LKQMKANLKAYWTCSMPTTPYDDLLADYDGDKDFFFQAIDDLITDGTTAIETEKNQLKASKLWKKHLGGYFPEGEDADVDQRAKSLAETAATILAGKAKINNAGDIQDKSGVGHLPHKNFGGDEIS